MNYSYQTTWVQAFSNLYTEVVSYLPNLIMAIVVVLLGWILGSLLSKLVQKVLAAVKVDTAAGQLGLETLSERVGRPLSISRFGGWIVKWFFFLGSFMAATDILGLENVSDFLYQDVLGYAGSVLVAAAVLLLGVLAARFFGEIVTAAVKASGWATGHALGAVTRWAILIFSVIVALEKLGLAAGFLQDLFRAIVAMLAIAGGLAFGLGGRDHAKKILDHVESNLSR